MENFPGSLDTRVLRFATSWTKELHLLGYRSGFYSNSDSGIADLVKNYANTAYVMPDIIYDALWNDAANTSDPSLPATDWPDHQRIHQYLGGQNVTYGGDTINIDQDYLDVQLPGGGLRRHGRIPAGFAGRRPARRGRDRLLPGHQRPAVA